MSETIINLPEMDPRLPPLPFKPQLRTIKSARRTLARVIRGFADGTIAPDDVRTVTHLLSMLLAFFKESAAIDIANRLAVVEKRLKKLEVSNAEQQTDPPTGGPHETKTNST